MIFANCFIGIPLPAAVEIKVRELQMRMTKIIPSWEVAENKIMHLTLYYLNSQKVEALEEIANRVVQHLPILDGEKLSLEGLGYFTLERPKVLFLQVEYSTRVDQFYRILTEELAEFRNEDEDRDFRGHVTLGRLHTNESVQEFLDKKTELETLAQANTLDFAIGEVGIYVRDDKVSPSNQQLWRRFEL